MGLRISGKNVDTGDAFRTYVDSHIGEALAKYFDGGFTGHVIVEREGSGFRTTATVHLDTGIVLQAEGTAQDIHQSFDQASERIAKRLRRYKGKLKDHHRNRGTTTAAREYVIEATDEHSETPVEGDPVVIAEQTTNLETLSVGGAVMAMDLAGHSVVVFRNAAHGGVNVIYRRTDGNIGWIDPALDTGKQQNT